MKKLPTLALCVVMLTAFTGLSVAQERKAGEKSAPPKEEPARKLKGAKIVGKELILEKGFTFRETAKGVQVVDPTGRYATTLVCSCSGSGGCRVTISGGSASCVYSGCSGNCIWEIF